MFYLYNKSKSLALPEFNYIFKGFKDFYELSQVLTVPLRGSYCINIVSDDYREISEFINVADTYSNFLIYIEVTDAMMKYVTLYHPKVKTVDSKSNFEVFKNLVEKYEVLFDKGAMRTLYFAVPHEYADMEEAVILMKQSFPSTYPIKDSDIARFYVVDTSTYPRTVLISYLRMDRFRRSKLRKSVDVFGNDLVLYSMRKNVRKMLEEYIIYLKTGNGSELIKTIPVQNIIMMYKALDLERRGFKDIVTILNLYERGETINDIISERTFSIANA